MTSRIVGIAGRLTEGSKTLALVGETARQAGQRHGAAVSVHDLGELGPSLSRAEALEDLDTLPLAVAHSLVTAKALILGARAGFEDEAQLVLRLLDLVGAQRLAGKPVLIATVGEPDRRGIEEILRRRAEALRMVILPASLHAHPGDFPITEALRGRISQAIGSLAPFMAQGFGLAAE